MIGRAELSFAYCNEEKNAADRDTLADVAATTGMDRAETLARLQRGDGAAKAAAAIEDASRLGVTGVPFFVFDNRYALSGAQPPGSILAAMRQTVGDRVATG